MLCEPVDPTVFAVYGLTIKSDWELPCRTYVRTSVPDIQIRRVGPNRFPGLSARASHVENPSDILTRRWFADGSVLLSWRDMFEFHVSSDGRMIEGYELKQSSLPALQTYVLGQALSIALVRRGVEPLHATSLVVNDGAVALLGDCGFGKSTLAAAFLAEGHRLITDDVLVLNRDLRGFMVMPGPQRIKLIPDSAKSVVPDLASSGKMNPYGSKRIYPLNCQLMQQNPTPLHAIYVIRPAWSGRGSRITIRTITVRRAIIDLVSNTFNVAVREPARLSQQLKFASTLAGEVPIKSLSYPRELSRLPEVIEAVKRDVGQIASPSKIAA